MFIPLEAWVHSLDSTQPSRIPEQTKPNADEEQTEAITLQEVTKFVKGRNRGGPGNRPVACFTEVPQHRSIDYLIACSFQSLVTPENRAYSNILFAERYFYLYDPSLCTILSIQLIEWSLLLYVFKRGPRIHALKLALLLPKPKTIMEGLELPYLYTCLWWIKGLLQPQSKVFRVGI